MPIPIPANQRQLYEDPYGSVFKDAPSWLSTLARMTLPNPQSPYAFGTLRALDPRALSLLMQSKQLLPARLWDYLVRHPTEIRVNTRSMAPYSYYDAGNKSINLLPRTTRPDVMAHELTHAAQDLSGHFNEPLPGLHLTHSGQQAMLKAKKQGFYNLSDIPSEKLPVYYYGQSYAKDPFASLNALESWWPKQ